MEVRSSRRMRTLVTQMAHRGLSANENARALISMMARSKRSNQRPDTLMQDRLPHSRESRPARDPVCERVRTCNRDVIVARMIGAK